jgi:hypothetical protein
VLNLQPFNTEQLSGMLLLLLLLMAETCLQLPGDLCSTFRALHRNPDICRVVAGGLQKSAGYVFSVGSPACCACYAC